MGCRILTLAVMARLMTVAVFGLAADWRILTYTPERRSAILQVKSAC